MYSANVMGPAARMRSSNSSASGVRSCADGGAEPADTGGTSIPALRIAREHLDDVVVQTVVELALKGPGELRVLQVARLQGVDVGVDSGLRGTELDQDLDPLAGLARSEGKQRVLVAGQLATHHVQMMAGVLAHSGSLSASL